MNTSFLRLLEHDISDMMFSALGGTFGDSLRSVKKGVQNLQPHLVLTSNPNSNVFRTRLLLFQLLLLVDRHQVVDVRGRFHAPRHNFLQCAPDPRRGRSEVILIPPFDSDLRKRT